MKRIHNYYLITLLLCFFFIPKKTVFSQEAFKIHTHLKGQHPRILFTEEEAEIRARELKQQLPQEWDALMNQCKNIGYPSTTSIPGQRQWWYFSRMGIGVGLSKDATLIAKGKSWLNTCYQEDWEGAIQAETSVGLDVAHKLAGFALLYDCMYNYLDSTERSNYEELMKTGMTRFRIRGYDLNDYWTNDYQNNHMHFRATASLYCAINLIDKYPEMQSEYNYVKTVWERILHVSPHDGSNHEGLNYANYGGQMLYPGIHALRHCTEMDPASSEHYRNVGYYYIYHVTPDLSAGFGFGDSANSAAASGPNYLFQIAALTGDPYIQYLASNLRKKHSEAFFLAQWPAIYIDPNLEKKNFQDLPLHRYFEDIGIVICRNSWDPDATAIAFKCGPLGGHILNETRGTAYSHFTDYVNVAHDDPDAGTFLLFSKGSFLTTGDGYEKKNKITTQHSTFIVDDATQYGGGGAWSQPKKLNQYAWQKEFAEVNDRVVFSGDMKGVYPGMRKLNRTFVSHKANYIVIYDDAASVNTGRTFEWRLQTEGELIAAGEKTYNITNGNANALAKILSPAEADWSVTTNNIGNILRARLSNQQNNRYMILLWPNASDLNAIAENINTEEALGVKVVVDGKNEYTLFGKTENEPAEVGKISFNGNTLLLFENEDKSFSSASLVNGIMMTHDDVNYFSSTEKINFGIENISQGKTALRYAVGPSSETKNPENVEVTLGGLLQNKTWYLVREGKKTGVKVETNSEGEVTVLLDVTQPTKYLMSPDSILTNPLGTSDKNNGMETALNIYPNPSDGLIHVHYNHPSSGNLWVTVFTASGKQILKKQFEKSDPRFFGQLDLSSQPKGIYLVQLSFDDQTLMKKVVLH
ncbi:MAG: T9SS type A sorting domain-containing protein [Mariniphaga sp.]|nr:T9SS type A sorting domain-containing protein [Mariniphaga sp.]MDD4424767.1 T9SS type A sorting domain-containing protein [Mariniphaga sp.]